MYCYYMRIFCGSALEVTLLGKNMYACKIKKDMRCGVRTEVTIRKTVLWDTVSCRMVEINESSEIIYCVYHADGNFTFTK